MADAKSNKRIIEKYEREVLGSLEPKTIDKNNYKVSLMKALNYYNVNIDKKTKRKWTLEYIKKTNPSQLSALSELPDWKFTTVGTLIRMQSIGLQLEQNELDIIKTTLTELINEAKNFKPIDVVEDKPKANIQDKILNKAREFAGELDYQIDMYLMGKSEVLPDLHGMLVLANIPKLVANHIPKFYNNLKNELIEAVAGKDEQLNEGYSHLSKSKLKKAMQYLIDIENVILNYGIKIKVAKPRVVKQKSPLVLTKNVKYKQEDTELKIKSVNPVEIIGASEVWLYNTKYKKLMKYSGSNISIKGTTLTNYDVDESQSKTLRKPNLLSEMISLTKKKLETEFKNLKTTATIPNGRINPDTLILKVFK